MAQTLIRRAAVIGPDASGNVEVAMAAEGQPTAIVAIPQEVARVLRRDLGIALKAVPVARQDGTLDVDETA